MMTFIPEQGRGWEEIEESLTNGIGIPSKLWFSEIGWTVIETLEGLVGLTWRVLRSQIMTLHGDYLTKLAPQQSD